MIAGRGTVSLVYFSRFRLKWLVCLFVSVSTLFGFLAFYNFHDYEPWHVQTLKALGRTFEAHSGLWLATLLIPSSVGVYLLLWNYNLLTVAAAALVLSWLLYKVLRGERFDD